MPKNIVDIGEIELRVTSFIGVSMGAQHFYGELVCYKPTYKTVELEHLLTRDEARRSNKRDRFIYAVGYRHHYKEGQASRGFETREDVVECAKQEWLKHFPRGKRLILENAASRAEAVIAEKPAKRKKK